MTSKPILDFDAELAKLAKAIVQKATQENTPFEESVDAFKALTAYYALRLKHKPDEDEPDDGFSFASSRPGEEHENGGAPVRTRSRRPS